MTSMGYSINVNAFLIDVILSDHKTYQPDDIVRRAGIPSIEVLREQDKPGKCPRRQTRIIRQSGSICIACFQVVKPCMDKIVIVIKKRIVALSGGWRRILIRRESLIRMITFFIRAIAPFKQAMQDNNKGVP